MRSYRSTYRQVASLVSTVMETPADGLRFWWVAKPLRVATRRLTTEL